MKTVYVDTSHSRHITIVDDEDKRVYHDSTENYGKHLKTHEAEYIGIICALETISGDLVLSNDNEGIIKVLNGESSINRNAKLFVERIKKLCEDRVVKFKHENRDINKASLHQRGYALSEINNPKWLEMKMTISKETREKQNKMWHRKKE